MPTFILTLNWTEQGIRAVKDAPKRSQAAKELAKKLGVEIKQAYLTSGEHDLLLVLESASGDNVAKFALATGALGNVRTSTARAWSEPEWHKLISELPWRSQTRSATKKEWTCDRPLRPTACRDIPATVLARADEVIEW
jgi:uncharacterized protein with GYD domain